MSAAVLLGAAIPLALTTHYVHAGTLEEAFQSLHLSALIEIEATAVKPQNGETSSDISVATVELGLQADVNDWVEGEVVFLYEQDQTDFGVDSATVTIAPPDGPWFVTAGLFAQPFGRFDTHLVSEPLTVDLGETYETSLQAGVGVSGFTASAYVFNGDSNKTSTEKIDNFGMDVGYSMKAGEAEFSAAAGYINNIGDSDTLQDSIANPVADYVAGWFVSANAVFGSFNLVAEYLTAADAFHARELAWQDAGAQPLAWHLEAAYTFNLAGKESTFALGYQGTREALALELPESRFLAAWSVGIVKNTTLSLEWAHDEDYALTDGGSGESSNAVTAQLAVVF